MNQGIVFDTPSEWFGDYTGFKGQSQLNMSGVQRGRMREKAFGNAAYGVGFERSASSRG
jgi:hypothetical protein